MRYRPRLQIVLFSVNILILLLPLGSIALFRIYESELMRQTEASLIGQGALVAAGFHQEMVRQFELQGALDQAGEYGNRADPRFAFKTKGVYDTIPPRLDIATDQVFPPGEDARVPEQPPDWFATPAGAAMEPILKSARNMTLTGIRVVDKNGVVVASSGTESGMSLVNRQEVPRALAGEPVSLLRKRSDPPLLGRGKRVRVFVAIPVIHEDRVWGAVVLSRTPLDMFKSLYLIRWHLIPMGLLLLILVALVTLGTTLLISRPVKALIDQSEKVAAGDTRAARPLEKPGTREVDRLSHAVASMARSLADRADHVRALADSVSHGLKTPLTSLSATVELLRDPGVSMTDEERARLLQIMDREIGRLNRLVRGLLDLARADVAGPGDKTANLARAIDSLAAAFREKGRRVECVHQDAGLEVAMGAEALDSVLSHLWENAWLHGSEDTRVRVETGPGEEGGVAIRVEDDGPGISAANREKIFSPFFTTAAQKGGSGLGLSIVQTFMAAHGGTIELMPGREQTVFLLQLPGGSCIKPPGALK